MDLAIIGGHVYDGSYCQAIKADLGIDKGRIVKIGEVDPSNATEVIDASNLCVTPGFIDIHSHADSAILDTPHLPAKLLQGVTTDVFGNCGLSASPINEEAIASLKDYMAPTLGVPKHPFTWNTFGEYLSEVESLQPSLNVASLVGHGTLRLSAMGFSPQAPNKKQMETMVRALEESLQAGAFGMSLGLIYAPSGYATESELETLCGVLRKYDGLLAVHMRNESDMFVESVLEVIALAKKTGVRLNISHLKASGAANWGKPHQVLEIIEKARAEGVKVTCDQYPYTAGSTTITVLFPQWSLEGGVAGLLSRLGDPKEREKIKRDFAAGIRGWDCLVRANGWNNIMLSWIQGSEYAQFEGKTMADMATSLGKDPVETLFDFVLDIGGNASIVVFQQSDDDVQEILQSNFVAVGSDGLHSGVRPHPRLYGTFPRVLGRYVRELGAITMEEAIRKMTALPAKILGFSNRGQLKEGFIADINVFDPEQIGDQGTYTNPAKHPIGFKNIVVNGVSVVKDGVFIGAKPGRVLRHK